MSFSCLGILCLESKFGAALLVEIVRDLNLIPDSVLASRATNLQWDFELQKFLSRARLGC